MKSLPCLTKIITGVVKKTAYAPYVLENIFKMWIKYYHYLHVLPDEVFTCKSIHNIRKSTPIKVKKITILHDDPKIMTFSKKGYK